VATQWFTSDHHFGHHNIIEYCNRPYKNTDDMNVDMIGRWNATVAPEDIVHYVGDFSLSKSFISIAKDLNGKIILYPGNHDKCFAPKSAEALARLTNEYLAAGFSGVNYDTNGRAPRVFIGSGLTALICHFPYTGDSRDRERYTSFRPKDQGEWLIHGHVHDTWRQRGRMINVGADAWAGVPVSIDTIADMMTSTKNERELDPLLWL
jgi:calcineurin-like phosphoesterase family protein